MTSRSTLGRTFIDTRSLVFWVMVGLSVYGVIHLTPLLSGSLTLYPAASLLAVILWATYGLVLAVLIYRLELFERRSPVTMLGAFLWGALVVAGIGVVAAPAMSELVGKLLPADMADWIPAFAAPLVEEPLKMLGVVALAFIPSARINSAVDGLFYGLLVGLGFEITESLLYTIQGAASEGGSFTMVVLTFILRGIVGGLWNHPTYAAIAGAGVGYFFGSRSSLAKRTAALVGSLIAAMVLHGFFDSPLFENGNPFLSSIIKGLPALVLLVVLYRMAQGKERRRFRAIADAEVPDELISPSEMETLSTRRGRRKARRAVRHESGMAAGHALKRLQRRQSELVASIVEEGPDAERTREVADDVREARGVLADVTATT